MISLNSILGMLRITFRTQQTEKGPDTVQTRLLVGQKLIKWAKEGAILMGAYSDYYCRGLLCSLVSFWFHFSCFAYSVVFFTSSETSIHWSHRLLAEYSGCKMKRMNCKVLLYCIWKGFEAVVMFRGYSYCLIFLLIHF